VRTNVERLQDAAPAGYAAVVDVYIVGRRDPVRLSEVHTMRDASFPWTLLIADTQSVTAECLFFTQAQSIERIEVRLEESESIPDTFPIEWLDEDDEPDDAASD